MNFKDLENAIPFETVLVSKGYSDRYFVGINPYNNKLMTLISNNNNTSSWEEDEIKDWHIKQPEPEKVKVYCYRNVDTGHLYFSSNGVSGSDSYTRINPEFVQGGE